MASPSDAPASVAPSPIAARRGFPHVTAVHVFIAGAVGILLAAFVLRVYRLGDNNIWWDEGLAIWAVRKSFLGVTAWTASDVHPPLYFWALWPWVRLVGESEFAARFLSLAIGMLTVAAVVPLGRLLGGPWVGLLAGLLLATSRFHVWWSQEMRMYALAGLLNVLALIALLRWWRSGSRAAWLGYVLAAAASLWTIYLSVVMLAVANVWVAGMLVAAWWRGRQASTTNHRPLTTRLWMWLGAQLAALVLFAPWLMYALGRMSSWSVAETIDYGFVARLQATLLTLGIHGY
ncbi:MAG: glycosyltransferase family 39 protein [Anaerolineae bacterium]|nr:glycosyltransferase family 39 protein [Anaerolineae bacterium]